MRAIVLLLLTACATSPRQSVPEAPPSIPETRVTATPAVNPVGEFEWSSSLPNGTPIKGTMSITGTAGAYAGAINAGEHGVFPIKNVVVTGQSMVITAEHPDGPVEVRLTFVANDFTGAWQLGAESAEMVGKRVR